MIINSNDSIKKSKKDKKIILKKTRENGMKKRLLIVEGWDIAVDDDCVNFLDSKINDFKSKFGISNDDSEDNSNESNFS